MAEESERKKGISLDIDKEGLKEAFADDGEDEDDIDSYERGDEDDRDDDFEPSDDDLRGIEDEFLDAEIPPLDATIPAEETAEIPTPKKKTTRKKSNK